MNKFFEFPRVNMHTKYIIYKYAMRKVGGEGAKS